LCGNTSRSGVWVTRGPGEGSFQHSNGLTSSMLSIWVTGPRLQVGAKNVVTRGSQDWDEVEGSEWTTKGFKTSRDFGDWKVPEESTVSAPVAATIIGNGAEQVCSNEDASVKTSVAIAIAITIRHRHRHPYPHMSPPFNVFRVCYVSSARWQCTGVCVRSFPTCRVRAYCVVCCVCDESCARAYCILHGLV
jgi:hypothetical protein